jgi:hypothetical protein
MLLPDSANKPRFSEDLRVKRYWRIPLFVALAILSYLPALTLPFIF